MAGLMPDCGSAWIPDTGGGGGGALTPGVLDEIGKGSEKGVVISGVVTWITAQIGTHGTNIWKSLAMRSFLDGEVSAAKDALKSARGEVLEGLVSDFKTKRQVAGRKAAELEDIRKAIVALQDAGEMPLILATSTQMTRCPQSWGVPETATVQDVMGKVLELEKAMTASMECQREQMTQFKQEMTATRKGEVRSPALPNITLTADTPSKKRRIAETQDLIAKGQSYAGAAALPGVTPLTQPGQMTGLGMLKNLLQPKPQKPQRNICFGSAKTSGEGPAAKDTLLAADVSLVASGVGKGCTTDDLKNFLAGKGINAVEVEMLTKKEVMEQVRTLTFRVAVKAADYEAALKPEVWPYRVGVRHYKAPRRERTDNSWQGQVEQSGGGEVHQGQHRQTGTRPKQHLPPGHQRYGGPRQQVMEQPSPGPIEISNFYNALAALGINSMGSPMN